MENNEKGLGEKYNRELFDDIGRRNNRKDSFKNREFKDKKTTTDKYTGKKLYYDKRKDTSKTSNVDHITPIERVYDRHKNNKFITPDDIKEIVNADPNLVIVSESFNKSKGNKTNFQYIVKKVKDKEKIDSNIGKMLGDQLKSEIYIEKEISKKTINKVSNLFKEGADKSIKSSNAMTILVGSSVENMCMVAAGEKDLKEATIDTCKSIGTYSATSVLVGGSKEVIEYTLSNESKALLQNSLGKLNNTLVITRVVTIGVNVTENLVSYLNGEISEEEFFLNINECGLNILAGMIGGSVGVALMIASMIIMNVYRNILNILKSVNAHEKRLREVSRLINTAVSEIKKQNDNLEKMIQVHNENYDKKIKYAFEKIYKSTLDNDVNIFSNALNEILEIFKEEVYFKDFEEFEEFFMDENSVFIL